MDFMLTISKPRAFDVLTEVSLLVFLSVVMAYGPDVHKVFIPAEVLFVSVFGIRFIVKRYKMTKFVVWSLVFIFLSFCSLVYATNRPLAFSRAISVVQVLAFANLLIPYIRESKRTFQSFLVIFILGAFFIVLRLLLNTSLEELFSRRLGETIDVNANTVGYMLSVAGLISFYLCSDKKKWYYALIGLFFCFLSLFSGSRKVVVILGMGLCLLVFLSQKTKRRSFISLGLMIFILTVSLFAAMNWEPLYQIFGNRIALLFSVFSGGEIDESTSIRIHMIIRGWELFSQKPILGWGLGAFTDIGGFGIYAHNNYIELLVALGLVGTIWYYSIFIYIFGTGVKRFFTSPEKSSYVLSLTLIVVMMFVDMANVSYTEEFSNVLLALCYAGIVIDGPNVGLDIFQFLGKCREWLKSPRLLALHILRWRIFRLLSDKAYISLKFRLSIGSKLSLTNPQTFNEKMQWLKLYDRKANYPSMVDKYLVRDYVVNTIGSHYLIPLIGVYDTPEEIDFTKFPEQFVLKCTHDSGSVFICTDKESFDQKECLHKIKAALGINFFWNGREWPYKNVKPRIICEQLLTDGSHEPKDYKVYCYNGVPKIIRVHEDRHSGHTQKFYDETWNPMDIHQDESLDLPTTPYDIPCPLCFDKMMELSQVLGKGIPYLRVDWYVVSDTLYFGELTFYEGSGFEAFDDIESDLLLGSWIALPL